jgi:TPP-dependent pyruvate/acetoin dehydrogenase alpha subunit
MSTISLPEQRTDTLLPVKDLIELYRQMVLARRFEAQTERSFRRGKIGGYLHEYSGQEAVALGFLRALREDDIFFTAYRDHAHALFCGSEPRRILAELYGKVTGLCRGKGGSMHLFDVARGFYGGYGIVGNHVPLAVGAAYALRYHDTDRVCLCFLGDGAMNSGALHEASNMAGLWGQQGLCPVVFVVENNLYALATSLERSSAVTNLASRFDAYDIANEQCDGQDVLTVYGVARARAALSPAGGDRAVAAARSDYAARTAAAQRRGAGRRAGRRDRRLGRRGGRRRGRLRGGEPGAAAGGLVHRRLRRSDGDVRWLRCATARPSARRSTRRWRATRTCC